MFDVVITGGTIVDGTGGPAYPGDLGVTSEKIQAVGDLGQAEARRVIDATGLTVSPGFIDTHVHSDGALLVDPQHANGLRQGITTEILGQDGLSYCPLSAENYRVYSRYLTGILGEVPQDLDMSSVAAFRSHYNKKTAINTAYLVAHGAVRLEALGFYDKPLVGDALEHAKRLITEGIEQGACGFATGMSYHPQSWSDTDEMVELCKSTHEAGGVYVTHLRNVNPERGFGGGGIPEALEIGRRSGVRVHFSHTRTAEDNAGRVSEVVELVDKAKGEVDSTLELYPYPTGSTFAVSNLPSYAHDGGPDEILKRLKDPAQRRKIADELEASDVKPTAGTVLSYVGNSPGMEGKTIPGIAEERGLSQGEALCDMLVEEDLKIGFWLSPPDDVRAWRQVSRDAMEFLSRPDYMVGSDAIPVGGHPHPRAYGTFPRFIGRLRRQFGVLTLEQTVQRMTQNAAERFGLTGRGVIKKGNFADIVAFDAEHIIDTATYDDPKQYPVGIPYVLVNGQVAVDQERCTGVMAGHAVP